MEINYVNKYTSTITRIRRINSSRKVVNLTFLTETILPSITQVCKEKTCLITLAVSTVFFGTVFKKHYKNCV